MHIDNEEYRNSHTFLYHSFCQYINLSLATQSYLDLLGITNQRYRLSISVPLYKSSRTTSRLGNQASQQVNNLGLA